MGGMGEEETELGMIGKTSDHKGEAKGEGKHERERTGKQFRSTKGNRRKLPVQHAFSASNSKSLMDFFPTGGAADESTKIT